MAKQRKWQFYAIIAVILLTLYNILPTIFYYSKPLKAPIDSARAQVITHDLAERINQLEPDSEKWLASFCRLIQVSPHAITVDADQPQKIHVQLKDEAEARRFRQMLPRAGALIPFVPAQLALSDQLDVNSKTVLVQRKIPIRFDLKHLDSYFQFAEKWDAHGRPSPLYQALVEDRILHLAIALTGSSENALYLQGLAQSDLTSPPKDILLLLAQNIVTWVDLYGETSPITQRYFQSFSRIDLDNRERLIDNFLNQLNQHSQEALIAKASLIVKRNKNIFSSGSAPWTFTSLGSRLQQVEPGSKQTLYFGEENPYIESLAIDWEHEIILLNLHPDLLAANSTLPDGSNELSQANQLLYNAIAAASRLSDEKIRPTVNQFEINLSQLPNSKSFIAMKLGQIADAQVLSLKNTLSHLWNPTHPDLAHDQLPIYDYPTYQALAPEQKQLALVVYAPALYGKAPPQGLHLNSIYVIAKGMDRIVQRLQSDGESEDAKLFVREFHQLEQLLRNNGFIHYSGQALGLAPEFAQDFIFEAPDYYQMVLKASREDFSVHGTKRYALLELTDVEQRLLTTNKIETRIHEDLLKWRDDYAAAQLEIKGVSRFDVPKPTQNAYLSNFKLSFAKYFRGDERKILHWGLDLSGGKTVQIELRDMNGKPVHSDEELRQGINELYNRVNKMGVSEVNIRQEGHYITLDFPGSQNLSAAELVKASSMYFHIVNETFSNPRAPLSHTTQRFLQDVWNEAVVTNRKSPEEINLIAWSHLYGDAADPDVAQPRTDSAKLLYDHGLRLSHPEQSMAFDETFSKIALLRGDDFTDWQGQTHPLLIVFQSIALEGSHLDQIHAGYDPSKGNYLSFSIKSPFQNTLYEWSSRFAKEQIGGTPEEIPTGGQGWRMAVILNGSVISSPTLDSALRDHAMITGSFTQREVNQLAADLKAGSLSFTPYILSEKNVSPDLGSQEKTAGIFATITSLLLVIGVMLAYYRFGGLVASIAVLLNLIIMWATLQNLDATMTLAGIAGIILTVGMAVDANVLVFERIREEFAITQRIASAVHAGYRKAFSAIVDSNITTIIAALVLLQFDSGPIKGFAITLIIGIVSSMFTALFMTRFFFAGWVQNPKHKALKMANWFKPRNFNFLKHTKMTWVLSGVVILLGTFAFIQQRNTLFGMDFKGGYALNLELAAQSSQDYRHALEGALVKAGASFQEFQVRELTPSNHLRLFLSRSLEEPGHPFYEMPIEQVVPVTSFSFESNPKIAWVVTALQKADLSLTPHSLNTLDQNWTEVSGQMSSVMRNSAILGLSVALLCILLYITIRFEWNYAISATLGLAHDLIFTLGAIALLHAVGVPVQIDLNTIAALMTMVGYSLNDTIIVFDRIREDRKIMHRASLKDIINHALNITLSRTLLTSGTTLLVLVPLILFGGATLFGFALVMAIGVIFGTLSSLFIAAPMMKFFHDRAQRNTPSVPMIEPRP